MSRISAKQARLTSESLARNASRIDKSQFIRSYLQSQKSFRAAYIKEGFDFQAGWGGSHIESNVKETPHLPEPVSSPVLKPRVPSPPPARVSNEIVPSESSNDDKKENMPKNAGNDKAAHRNAKKFTTKARPKSPPRKQATLDQYATKPKKHAEPSKKRQRSHDSEADARLAERRERRRAKRAIVQPKPTSEDEEESDQSSKKRTKKDKMSKKMKKGDIAAGLALMYGFTAPNVGSNRLTLKPPTGLFHKGRASSPSKNKKKQRGKGRAVFSESTFLQSRACTRKGKKRAISSSTPSDSEAYSSDTDDHLPQRSPLPNKGKSQPKPESSTRQKQVVPKQRSDTPSETSARSASSSSSNEKNSTQVRKQKTASIIWDIELPGHVPGSDSEVTKSNTMVVNARRHDWDTSQVVHHSKPPTQPQQSNNLAGPPAGGTLSVLSLRPSQSASQIVTEEPRKPDKIGFSKYFDVHRSDQDANVPQGRQPTEEIETLESQSQDFPQTLQKNDPLPEPEHRTGDMVAELQSVLVEVEPATSRHSRPPSRESLCSLDRELQSTAGLYPHLSCHSSDRDSQQPTFCRAYEDSARSLLAVSEPLDGVYLDNLTPQYLPTGELELDIIMDPLLAANENELFYAPVFISDGLDHEEGCLDDVDEDMDQAHLDLDLLRDDPTEDVLYYADESYCIDIDSLEDISQDAIPQSFWQPSDADNLESHAYTLYELEEDSGLMMQDPDSMVEAYTEGCLDETTRFSDSLSIGTKFAAADYEYSTSSIDGIEADTEEHAAAPMEMQCFSQGRALLLGIANDTLDCEDDHREAATLDRKYRSLSKIEEDVAKRMKGHWLPQRL